MFCISDFLSQIILEDFSRSINRKRMAGRAKDLLISSSRPSPKGNLLILHYAVDVKRPVEEGKDYPWPKPHRCPSCQGVQLWGHGYVFRYFEGFSCGLWMKRFRCPDCGGCTARGPKGSTRAFIIRGFRFCFRFFPRPFMADGCAVLLARRSSTGTGACGFRVPGGKIAGARRFRLCGGFYGRGFVPRLIAFNVRRCVYECHLT